MKVETTLLHGLRHVPTGRMVRVREVTRLLQEEPYRNEEVTWHMTFDEDCPIFDAGSPENLALALSPSSGVGPGRPAHDEHFVPSELEAVTVERVLTTTVRRISVEFDAALQVAVAYATDVGVGLVRSVPELFDVMDAVDQARRDLEKVSVPGEVHELGDVRLVGLITEGDLEHDRSFLVGRLVTGGYAGVSRRAVGSVTLPAGYLSNVLGTSPTPSRAMIVCLSDARALPDDLADELRRIAEPPLPVPG